MTGITCQRCGRPICGECMIPASVGFQCPECVARARSRERDTRTTARRTRPRGSGAGRLATLRSQSATVLLIGLIVVIQAVDSVSLGLVQGLLAYQGQAVLAGQVWRLVTHVLVSGGILALVINGFVLWMFGRTMETMWGRWRFLATYFLAGLGAAVLMLAAGPTMVVLGGASTSIIGLLAANAGAKFHDREDARADLVLLAVLIAFSIFSYPAIVLADVGAILAGGACGWLWSTTPGPRAGRRRGSMTRSDQLHLWGAVAILGVCVVVAAVAFLVR
ncbi:rhomboid family intramembrane serine protease [Raineyella sp. W15-4]|uniref:rhomboid family intramembrane serine protease n=1 Tax=Raineyella sp. W15-4 TaxID=3081651 RepID=UPI0029549B8E|nr:rhomboid family intramembrane serine protease [Raineyella sp. W15-4]WOQ15883.1 rhomboid family intramembrane serine protease [Raineyella sp. W15-4]